jgi:[ribosomal protein S5]-alanine N-acetyltransferase
VNPIPLAPTRRFPTLEVSTPRLLVRPLVAADVRAIAAVFDDRQARRWLSAPEGLGENNWPDWCTPDGEDGAQSRDGARCAVIRRHDSQLIGCVWARRTDWQARSTEVSVAIASTARGVGFAAEAIDALILTLVREHGFQRVEMRVVPGNLAARWVAEKAGFTYEGLLRNAGQVASGRVDLECWSLVSGDLRGTP